MASNKYTRFIFDLDGTIVDSSLGIVQSALTVLKEFSLEMKESQEIKNIIIGPPLTVGLGRLTGVEDPELMEQMIVCFRKYYAEQGVHENILYPNISKVLEKLHQAGASLEVLTSKPERFAVQIMQEHKLDHLFERIDGAGERDKKSMKSEKLAKYAKKSDVIMIGDRSDDVLAAVKNEIHSIGVTYGFGTREDLVKAGATYIFDTEEEILTLK